MKNKHVKCFTAQTLSKYLEYFFTVSLLSYILPVFNKIVHVLYLGKMHAKYTTGSTLSV